MTPEDTREGASPRLQEYFHPSPGYVVDEIDVENSQNVVFLLLATEEKPGHAVRQANATQ